MVEGRVFASYTLRFKLKLIVKAWIYCRREKDGGRIMDLNALAQLSALVVAVLNAHAGPLALLNPTPDILTSPSHLASHLPRKQKTSLSSSLVILISCYLDGTLPFLLTRQRRDCLPC
ncbi:hypothetical protein BDE02_05G089800 [Populus trichocarpa]|nr:hypothetical protein BDE02_05G089800 [Populus trichocarpa]